MDGLQFYAHKRCQQQRPFDALKYGLEILVAFSLRDGIWGDQCIARVKKALFQYWW